MDSQIDLYRISILFKRIGVQAILFHRVLFYYEEHVFIHKTISFHQST